MPPFERQQGPPHQVPEVIDIFILVHNHHFAGGFSTEAEASRAYDRAALVYWGSSAQINGSLSDYEHEMGLLQSLTREEVVSLWVF